MLRHFQPFIDYKALIDEQSQERTYEVKKVDKKGDRIPMKCNKLTSGPHTKVLKIGRK